MKMISSGLKMFMVDKVIEDCVLGPSPPTPFHSLRVAR